MEMPIYARFGVAYAWPVERKTHTLEAYALEDGEWREVGRYSGDQSVSAAPFEAVSLRPSDLWTPR